MPRAVAELGAFIGAKIKLMKTKAYVVCSTARDRFAFSFGDGLAMAFGLALLTSFALINRAEAAAQTEKSPAPTAGKMVDPSQTLANIQTAIGDLAHANKDRMFTIKEQEAKDLGVTLSGIQKKVATVQEKYQAKPGQKSAMINERDIYAEIERSLSAKELTAIDVMRSLQYPQGATIQQYSPDPSQCAKHCEKSCGYDGVGNKVCWFTCYYCCGHGGC